MKNTKKMVSALLALLALPLVGCGSSSGSPAGDSGKKTISVIQYAPHGSLDNCYTGLLEGLAESGYKEGENLTVNFQNAQGDVANSDLMAKNMMAQKPDMIVGIATPSAMSAYSAAKGTATPVLFTAVSDPVAAGFMEDLTKPVNNITGSQDLLPLEEQVKLIRAFLPDATKIGVLYTTSEPNSISQLETLKGIAVNYGFEVIEQGVVNASEVATAATTLSAKVDCLNNFTDNNIVNNLAVVLQAANKAGIPVFGSEIEQVKVGCLASQGIDYVALGKETGKMAAAILKGEKTVEQSPVYVASDFAPVYNKTVADTFSLTLPEGYEAMEDVSAE